jgi:hypothetical protein
MTMAIKEQYIRMQAHTQGQILVSKRVEQYGHDDVNLGSMHRLLFAARPNNSCSQISLIHNPMKQQPDSRGPVPYTSHFMAHTTVYNSNYY